MNRCPPAAAFSIHAPASQPANQLSSAQLSQPASETTAFLHGCQSQYILTSKVQKTVSALGKNLASEWPTRSRSLSNKCHVRPATYLKFFIKKLTQIKLYIYHKIYKINSKKIENIYFR